MPPFADGAIEGHLGRPRVDKNPGGKVIYQRSKSKPQP